MKNIIATKLIFLFLIIFFMPIAKADFKIKDGKPFIYNEISKGDYDKYKNHIIKNIENNTINKNMFELRLNSLGGDLKEAIKIGRLVRSLSVFTVLDEDSNSDYKCASSCFFIYVAGINRGYTPGLFILNTNAEEPIAKRLHPNTNNKIIGMHRPYFNAKYFSGLNLETAKKRYNEALSLAKQYLLEMDIPQNIIDRIWRTASNEVIFISTREFEELIGKRPPFFSEYTIAIKKHCKFPSDSETHDYALYVAYDGNNKKAKELDEKIISESFFNHIKTQLNKANICMNNKLMNNRLQKIKTLF